MRPMCVIHALHNINTILSVETSTSVASYHCARGRGLNPCSRHSGVSLTDD